MIGNISNYFYNLNNAGQALFIVGVLLIVTFIILLIVVFKPEKKPKKIYGENPLTDRENQVLEKLKDINNISMDDINLDNTKTKDLKTIVDELKGLESKENEQMDIIQRYEDEQEDTAVISVNELLKARESYNMSRPEIKKESVHEKIEEDLVIGEPITKTVIKEESIEVEKPIEKKFIPSPEIFSSVFASNTRPKEKEEPNNNETFLNTLKEFRNNL